MKEIQKRFKFSGIIHDDDVLHSVSLHAEQDKEIAPSYVEVPVPANSMVPQYSPTIIGKSTEYNPSENCGGNFMSYKFQLNNNCYNYATNVATNSFAQPGRMTGKPLPRSGYTAQDVVDGAVSDGLKLVGKTLEKLHDYAKNAEPGHFVALMFSTPEMILHPTSETPDSKLDCKWSGDFHWARLDDLKTNSWSQKDGGDQVTNFDFAGKPISDPNTANWTVNQGAICSFINSNGKREPNPNDIVVTYDFVTYMFVPDTDKDKGITII